MPVQILDYLDRDAIQPRLEAQTKPALLRELARPIVDDLDPGMADRAVETLVAREKLGSTGIGEGIAVPHGKLPDFPEIRLAFGRHPEGVPFDAIDEKPVRLFFLVLGPDKAPGPHLKLLAKISRIVRATSVRKDLFDADDRDDLLEVLRRADTLQET